MGRLVRDTDANWHTDSLMADKYTSHDFAGACAECLAPCIVDPNYPKHTLCSDCTACKMGQFDAADFIEEMP